MPITRSKSVARNGQSRQRPREHVLVCIDAFDWLERARPASIHAVVTDPPYGLIEYRPDQLAKRKIGRGGVWRIPPSFDGCRRQPLPRFTVLDDTDRERLCAFFARFAAALFPVLVPGAHVFIATNPLVSYLVYPCLQASRIDRSDRRPSFRIILKIRPLIRQGKCEPVHGKHWAR